MMGWLEYSTGNALPVAAPEHLGVDAAGQALAEGIEDRAVGLGVVRAVGVRMVRQLVHVAAQHVGRLPAQHAGAHPVDEGAVPVQVDPEDALAGGLQQQPELVLPERVGRRGGWGLPFQGVSMHGLGACNGRARLVRPVRAVLVR
jgi:hypothetical protein